MLSGSGRGHPSSLHPVFGPGEDRNTIGRISVSVQRGLHPVFGPGEDRNLREKFLAAVATELHPVFGPGEDRNMGSFANYGETVEAAPGLRTG